MLFRCNKIEHKNTTALAKKQVPFFHKVGGTLCSFSIVVSELFYDISRIVKPTALEILDSTFVAS